MKERWLALSTIMWPRVCWCEIFSNVNAKQLTFTYIWIYRNSAYYQFLWFDLTFQTYCNLCINVNPGFVSFIAPRNKQGITFLGCTSAWGLHKLRPLVIRKVRNPKCVKNIITLHVYKHTANEWMTAEIFYNWYFELFSSGQFSKWLPPRALEYWF